MVRAAIDLLDRPIVQVDVPDSAEALTEVRRGCTLLISAVEIDDTMKGFELAMRVKLESPDTGVIILGEEGDPDEFDEEMAAESPFIYFSRPIDIQKFLKVLVAGIEGQDIKAIQSQPAGSVAALAEDLGPVPILDAKAAQAIIDPLLIDLGAMAIILASRDGKVLLERGAVGYLNREQLTASLMPALLSAKDVKELVGGQISTVQFFDGEDYDVFMLSVGLHHFLCAMFDGQVGSRQFGVVNRFGRRAVEDLIALIGPGAFFFQPAIPMPKESAKSSRRVEKVRETSEQEVVSIPKADIPAATPEPEPFQLEPIPELNLDDIFGSPNDGAGLEDDMFDLDKIDAEVNAKPQGKGLSWDDAQKIGIIGGS